MMHVTSDINFKYFYYKGQSYTTGTKVRFTDSFVNAHANDEQKVWKYAVFSHRGTTYNPNLYVFWACDHELFTRTYNYLYSVVIKPEDIDNVIAEITKPIPITLVPAVPKKDWEVKGMGILWLIYIAVLFFSLIFRDFYVIWICATYGFFKIRKGLLNE